MLWVLVVQTTLALTLANYLYQFFTEKDWDRARDLSFFQFSAVLIFALTLKYSGFLKKL